MIEKSFRMARSDLPTRLIYAVVFSRSVSKSLINPPAVQKYALIREKPGIRSKE
jgi:hypothetical protein